MRKFGAVAVLLGALVVSADRTTVDVDSSVGVKVVRLELLPDGGCAVQAWADLTHSDGGSTREPSAVVEVTGANRTTCLDVINTRALALFKLTNGF